MKLSLSVPPSLSVGPKKWLKNAIIGIGGLMLVCTPVSAAGLMGPNASAIPTKAVGDSLRITDFNALLDVARKLFVDEKTAGTADDLVGLGTYTADTGTCPAGTTHLDFNENTTVESGECFSGVAVVNGKLGIGTTSPALKMQVVGSNGLPATTGTTPTGIVRFKGVDSSGVIDFGILSSGAGGWIQSTNQDALGSTYPLLLNPNGGNIGIGTTTPGTKLDVAGGVFIDTQLRIDGTAPETYFVDSDGTDWKIQAQDNHLLFLGGADLTEKMRLQSNGLLGLGTSTPSEVLDVAGNIAVTGTVDGVDVSDLSTTVGTNTAGIATNAADIVTNADDIADNVAAIATNIENIDTNLQAIAGKATLVLGATEGNLAGLNMDGDLTDSGVKVNDLGTGLTDLWSASQIASAITTATPASQTLTWTDATNILGISGGNTVEITGFQASNIHLDDLADGSLSGSKVGTGISATNVTTGTLPDGVLSTNVSLLGQTIELSEISDEGGLAALSAVSGGTGGTITDDTITNADINSAAGIDFSKLNITKADIDALNIDADTVDGATVNDLGTAVTDLWSASQIQSAITAGVGTVTEADTLGTVTARGKTTSTGINLNGTLNDITKGLTFGDADTGFYESADDNLIFSIAGTDKMLLAASELNARIVDGFTLLFESATSTNPNIAPNKNDPNTGIGSAGADQLSLIAGGVEGIRVNTATTGVNYLDVTPSATTDAVQISTGGTDTNIDLALMPKGTGNVGIGTTSPIKKLQINTAHLDGLTLSYTGTTDGEGSVIDFNYGGNNLFTSSRISSIKRGGGGGDLIFSSANTLSTFNEVMRLTKEGNVGIGDTTPDGTLKLDVEGQVGATGYCDENGANCKTIETLAAGIGSHVTNYRLSRELDLPYKEGNRQDVVVPEFNDVSFGGSHGLVYVAEHNVLYSTVRGSATPGFIRFNNPDDLSDYTYVAVSGVGNYEFPDQIQYSEEKDKIYMILGDIGWTENRMRVIEIDPVTNSYSLVIDDSFGATYIGSPTFTIIDNYLYATSGYYNPYVLKYDLDTFSRVGSLQITDPDNSGHNIDTDGKNLFLTSAYGTTDFIAKINPSTMTITDKQDYNLGSGSTTVNFTDDMVVLGEYLWLATENLDNNYILRVDKSDISQSSAVIFDVGAGSANIYNVFTDGTYVWFSGENLLGKIDPLTGKGELYDVSDSFNEMAMDSSRYFLTGFNGYPVNNNGYISRVSFFDNVKQSFVFGQDGTKIVSIDAISNTVGIGDTTPDGTLKLDVEGQVGATGYCDENGANCKTIAELSDIGTDDQTLDEVLTSGATTTQTMTVGNILPDMTGATGDISTRTLGSPTARFSDLYANEVHVGANSLYVNGKKVIHDNSDTMTFSTDIDQNVKMYTSGTGGLTLESQDTGNLYLKKSGTNGNLQIESSTNTTISAVSGISLTVPNSAPAGNHIYLTNNDTDGKIYLNASGITLTSGTAVDVQAGLSVTGAVTGASFNGVSLTNGGSGALTVTGTASISGTNTGDQDLSGFIPYTGATTDVDLGANDLTVNTDTLFVDSTNGKVGIGTATPGAKLEIRQAQTTNSATFTNAHLKLTDSGVTDNGGTTAITLGTSTADNYGISLAGVREGIDGTPSFAIRTHFGNAAGNEVFKILSNGNVGIGTTTPSEKLDVAGNIAVSGTVDGVDIAGLSTTVGTKADKVSGATAGNLAGLDASGNLTDSGLALNDTGSTTSDLWSGSKITEAISSGVGEVVEVDTLDTVTGRGATTTNAITTGGLTVDTDTLHVDATNNRVGIGTTAPTEKLEIEVADTDPGLKVTTAGATDNWLEAFAFKLQMNRATGSNAGLEFATSNSGSWGASGGFLSFKPNNTEAMRILNGGNVGIGTTTPGAPLQIRKDLANDVTTSLILQNNQYSNSADAGSEIRFIGLDSYADTRYSAIRSTMRINSNPDNIGFVFNSGSGEVETMTLDYSGNVGIGTTTPSYILDVLGISTTTPALRVYGGSDLASGGINDGQIQLGNGSNHGKFGYNSNGASLYIDNTNTTNGKIFIRTQTGGTPVNALTIDNAGSVGIGTTTPSETLDVAGGLRVDNNEWISARDSAGTGVVNMFRATTDGSIELGAPLLLGALTADTDSGAVSIFNMPVSETPVAGSEMSASVQLDSENIFKIYSEADGTGGIQNKSVQVSGDVHAIQYCDENGANCKTVSELSDSGTDSQSLTWTDATNILGISGGNTVEITGFQASNTHLDDLADGTLSSSVLDADLQDLADGSLTGSKVGTGISGTNITTGTVADARIASTITRDSEWNTQAEVETIWGTTLATDSELALKANIASPTFTGTVSGITSAMVGLGNVTNESKATMFTSPAFTGTPTAPTATTGTNTTQLATTAFVQSEITAGLGTITESDTLDTVTDRGATTTNAITTGGLTVDTNTLHVDATNNRVGIGTTTPAKTLEVSLGATGGYPLRIASGGVYGDFGSLDGGWFHMDTTSAQGFYMYDKLRVGTGNNQLGDASTNTWFNAVGGKTGIGTTTPTAQLHTKGGLNTALTGTVSVTASTAAVTGVGTSFTTQLAVGDSIKIGTETFTVATITDATHLTLDSNHVAGAAAVVAYADPNLFALDNGDGVNKVTVDKSGNVGIGTATPGSKLDITTTGLGVTQTTSSGLALVNHTPAADGVQQISPAIHWSGRGWKTGAPAASRPVDFRSYVVPVQGTSQATGYLTFESSVNASAYTNRMSITHEGNVGIGTTSPGATLDTRGNLFVGPNSNSVGRTEISSSSNNGQIFVRDNAGVAKVVLQAGGVSYINGGNVGIGTADPAGAKLEVQTTTGGTAAWFRGGNSGINIQTKDNLIELVSFNGSTYSPINIRAGGSGLTIDTSGAVGIGTTTPGEKLDVAGNIAVTGTVDGVDISALSTSVGVNTTNITSNASNIETLQTGKADKVSGATVGHLAGLDASGNLTDSGLALNDAGSSTTDLWSASKIGTVIGAAGTLQAVTDAGNTTTNAIITAGLTVDTDTLYVDATNNRVGIGTTSPLSTLNINGGTGGLSTGFTFGDGDTGIWESSDDNLRFSTLANTRMIIDSSGKVGVGTTTPLQKFHINDGTNVNLQAGAVGTEFQIKTTNDADSAYIPLVMRASEFNLMSGNVGIGTTTPAEKLHIYDGNIRLENSVAGGNYWRIVHNSADTFAVKDDSGVDYFTINSDGNIGIGITSPSEKLDVAGGLRIDNDSWLSARDTAGTGFVNMFKVNTNDEIEVGGQLNIGSLGLAEDSGAVTFVNMPVSSTPTAGTEESYSFSLDSTPVLKVYGEADGSGGIQNAAVKVDGEVHATGFCDETGANCKTVTELAGIATLDEVLTAGNTSTQSATLGGLTVDTDTLHVDATNNRVGVGTVSPQSPLHVSNTGSKQLIITDSDATTNLKHRYIQSSSGGMHFGLANDAYTGVDHVSIDSAGSVGIGLTNPGSKLQLYTPAAVDVMTLYSNSTSNTSNSNGFHVGLRADGNGTIWHKQGGSLVFGTSNFERLRINAAGNVGIGTATPIQKLDVAGTLALTETTAPTQVSTAGYIWSQNNAINNRDTTYISGESVALMNNRATVGLLLENGKVGIGTASPGQKLEVEGTDDTYILSQSTGANSDAGFKLQNDAVTWGLRTWGADGDKFTIDDDGSVRMAIDSAGNVGIGTTAPGAKLEVGAGTSDLVALFKSTDPTARIMLMDDDTTNSDTVGIGANDDNLQLYSGGAVKAFLSSGGDFGIGTTSPAAKLDVAGTFKLLNGSTVDTIESTLTSSTTSIPTSAAVAAAITAGADTDWVESGGDIYRATGNVGIGTTSPQSNFHISHATNPQLQITDTTSGETASDGFVLQQGNTNTYFMNQDSGKMYFQTFGSTLMTLDNGNVGIGTTAPGAQLHQAVNSVGGIVYHRIQNTDTTNSASGAGIFLQPTSSDLWGSKIWTDRGATSDSFSLNFGVNSSADPITTPRMTITNIGNVGIGTTNPLAKLGVSLNEANSNTAHYLQLQNDAAGYVDWAFSKTSSNDLSITNRGTGGSDTPVMTFQYVASGGNVGIGTTTPLSKLHINGGVGSLPTGLAFGDGDTGFYELVDDNLIGVIGTINKFRLTSTYLDLYNNAGARIVYGTPTATSPVFVPSGNDANTGIGHAADDQLSLIAGGTEIVNVATTGITVNGNIAVTGTVDGVDLSALSATVTTNTTDIATNAGDIADNVTAIATNATNIGINAGVISGKADMVSGATSGNIAGLDAYGNLTDSGLALNDSGTGSTDLWSAQQITAAIQGSAVPEADTLQTVTSRGATTTTGITAGSFSTSGTITSGAITATGAISTTVNTGSSYGIRLTDTSNNGTGNSMLEATGSSLFLKGVGSVQTYSDILPVSSLGQDLGSSSRKWGGLFTASLVDDGSKVTLNNEIIVERSATAANASSSNQTILGVTDTSAARTITLSTGDVVDGRIIIIKDESGGAGTNNITVVTEGSQTIDGAASIAITVDYGVLRVYSNGTNWFSF